MRKIFTGEGEITPYRPWSAERKNAASSPSSFDWTAERTLTLETMWAAGAAQTAIAKAIGATKGQVSGYIWRKGLSRSGGIKVARRTPEPPCDPVSQPAPQLIRMKNRSTFYVIEVSLDDESARLLDEFKRELDSTACANDCPDRALRLVYYNGRRKYGRAQDPQPYERWCRAEEIVARLINEQSTSRGE